MSESSTSYKAPHAEAGDDEPPNIIFTLQKKERERIQIAIKRFKGHQYLDLRTLERGQDASSNWRFTQKGITLRKTHIPDVISALQSAIDQMD